jgi:hypothetical protein
MVKGVRSMKTLSSYLRRLFYRRKDQRYLVRDGTSVVIVTPGKSGQDDRRQVTIIDISMGGTAFLYEGTPAVFESSGFINLAASTPHVENIHFDTVSDIPAPASKTTSESYRRRGVKFTWMGALGESYLKSFIQDHGIARQ